MNREAEADGEVEHEDTEGPLLVCLVTLVLKAQT